jgi:hypothetical protein
MMFTGNSVRGIQAGTKTQTRRLVTWQGARGYPHFFDRAFTDSPAGERRLLVPYHHPQDVDAGPDNPRVRHYPKWDVGDRIWVKETFRLGIDVEGGACVDFQAGGCRQALALDHGQGEWAGLGDECQSGKYLKQLWKSPLFMPRWASRLVLTVKLVRLQRLQDISEEDARAEGIEERATCFWALSIPFSKARSAYGYLWDAINGIGSWEKNPWIYAVSFERLT